MSDENKPLLQSPGSPPSVDYKSRSSGIIVGEGLQSPQGQQNEVSPKNQQTVSCRVCRNVINIDKKAEQHVVKCIACGEATPIRNPPPGKKYVRCNCNCLLVCNSSAPRIACPRVNCKRVISLNSTPSAPAVPSIPGMARVICVHCKDSFLFNTLKNVSARCPHCRRISSVGANFAKSRGHWYMAGFVMFLLLGSAVVGTTFQNAKTNTGVYVSVYVGLFALSLYLLGRSIYFYTMKVSSVGGSV